MELTQKLQRKIEDDLGLNSPFIKGQEKNVKNCWHFSTHGDAVDIMFSDKEDFRNGMNRIYNVAREHEIVILAFSLMDTHVHFVLHGAFDQCFMFMRDYINRTSRYISIKYNERSKLRSVPISHQAVDTEDYLKTVICYTIRNAPVAGIRANSFDYQWSSGPLYFREDGQWSSPKWFDVETRHFTYRESRAELKVGKNVPYSVRMIGNLVFPGEYVAYEIVERLFKTQRAYMYFCGRNKEEEVDSRGGEISRLSIPMQEMRQHRTEVCMELFGQNTVRYLNTQQRMRLAKTLKACYNSSLKQIIRLSGLVYEEVKDQF